jgi:hypothetical protein
MLLLLLLYHCILPLDSLFSKTIYAGGSIIVPAQETWQLKDAFLADGELYNIQISKQHFCTSYTAGDTIRPPFYIPEMELLSDKSMSKYFLRFYLSKQNKGH